MKRRPDSESYFLKLQREQIRLAERLEIVNRRLERHRIWAPAKTGKPGPRSWNRQERKDKAADAATEQFYAWLQGLPADSVVFTDSEESLLTVWREARKQLTKQIK